jgi:hypothetical protein
MIGNPRPAPAPKLAWVCLRSWSRTPASPARLATARHGRLRSVERGLLLLPDSKTGKKSIVLNAPAMKVLAELPRLGAYVIAGQSAGTDEEAPRPDRPIPTSTREFHVGERP